MKALRCPGQSQELRLLEGHSHHTGLQTSRKETLGLCGSPALPHPDAGAPHLFRATRSLPGPDTWDIMKSLPTAIHPAGSSPTDCGSWRKAPHSDSPVVRTQAGLARHLPAGQVPDRRRDNRPSLRLHLQPGGHDAFCRAQLMNPKGQSHGS